MSHYTYDVRSDTHVIITDKRFNVQHNVDLRANKCSCGNEWGCVHKDIARMLVKLQKES